MFTHIPAKHDVKRSHRNDVINKTDCVQTSMKTRSDDETVVEEIKTAGQWCKQLYVYKVSYHKKTEQKQAAANLSESIAQAQSARLHDDHCWQPKTAPMRPAIKQNKKSIAKSCIRNKLFIRASIFLITLSFLLHLHTPPAKILNSASLP